MQERPRNGISDLRAAVVGGLVERRDRHLLGCVRARQLPGRLRADAGIRIAELLDQQLDRKLRRGERLVTPVAPKRVGTL